MKIIAICALFIGTYSQAAYAQDNQGSFVPFTPKFVQVDPAGRCALFSAPVFSYGSNTWFTCVNFAWVAIGGSGGGAVSSVFTRTGAVTAQTGDYTASQISGLPTFPVGAIVGTTDTQALTNKTVDGVSPTTMAFVDPTSSIQTQLNAKVTTYCAATGGATSTLICAGSPAPTAYATGMIVSLTVDAATSGAVTLNVNSLGAKNIFIAGAALTQLTALLPGVPYSLFYDGAEFVIASDGPTSGDQASALTASIASQLPRFRLAVANVRAGTANAKVIFAGDSTTAGHIGGGGDHSSQSYVARVAFPGTNYAAGLMVPAQGNSGSFDERMSVGGGWTEGIGAVGFGSFSAVETTSAGTAVYTPGIAVNACTVYYAQTNGDNGIGSAVLTGGTPVSFSTANGTNRINSFALSTVTASSSNTVTLTWTSGGFLFVTAIECWNSGQKQILVGNTGEGSSTSSHWVSTNGYGSLPSIAAYAPDLTVISLGINDGSASVPVSTYIANIQAIITTANASGDVVLMSMVPSTNGTTAGNFEALYVPALRALAKTNNIPFWDIYGRFGGSFQSTLMGDGLHPTLQGYWDWGMGLTAFFSSIVGTR